jgi:hypothetical protein
MPIYITILLGVIVAAVLAGIFIAIRFWWLDRSLWKLYTIWKSMLVNTIALLYVAEKWKTIQMIRDLSYEEFVELCGDRVGKVFFNPFKWSRYYLLPNLELATKMKNAFDNGIATDDEEEHLLRARALLEQMRELREEKN